MNVVSLTSVTGLGTDGVTHGLGPGSAPAPTPPVRKRRSAARDFILPDDAAPDVLIPDAPPAAPPPPAAIEPEPVVQAMAAPPGETADREVQTTRRTFVAGGVAYDVEVVRWRKRGGKV